MIMTHSQIEKSVLGPQIAPAGFDEPERPAQDSPAGSRSVEASFEQLRDLGWRAAEHGDLQQALRFCDDAVDLALESNDQNLLDLAFCNRSSVLITLGRYREVTTELRQILIRGADAKNCFLAAYNLSRAHEQDKSFQKGLFYGRIARQKAKALRRAEWLASSYNQIANCLLAESYFEAAATDYRRALSQLGEEPSVRRTLILANLGYCKMMLGSWRDGMALSFQALRQFRRFRAEGFEVWPRLDLCYAYLESGRLRRARTHGERALEIAERTGDPTTVKNALYLLGEVERSEGETENAYGYFSRLQRRYYPDSPQLADLMARVSMRQSLNLRA